MATIEQAKNALETKLDSLIESTTDPNDTLLAVDALESLDRNIADESDTPTPSPQFHYRNQRAEFAIWSGQHWNAGGLTTLDNYLKPIKLKNYYHNAVWNGADARYYGYYAGVRRYQGRAANLSWFSTNGTIPSSDNCYINGTTSVGDIGHWRLQAGYRAIETAYDDTAGPLRLAEMIKCTNAEIDDADTYVTYDGLSLKHKYRHLTPAQDPLSSKTITGNGDNSYGSMSYNKTRQEMIIQNRDISDVNYNFRVSIYKNIPRINRDTKLETVILESNRTQLLYNMTAGYAAGDAETWSNNKIVLLDNGKIYVVTMNPTSGTLYIDLVERDANDTTLTYSTVANQSLGATVYGKQQNGNHGLRIMQSRNRKNILVFCQYYYYNAGITSYIIDKVRNTYVVGPFSNYSSHGVMPAPFGNQDFAVVKSHDWDNPGRQQLEIWVQKSDGSYVVSDPGPNIDMPAMSTSFPAMIPIVP